MPQSNPDPATWRTELNRPLTPFSDIVKIRVHLSSEAFVASEGGSVVKTPYSASLRPRNFRDQPEKSLLARATDAPTHWHALVAFIKTFSRQAVVEVTPRSMFAHGRDEIILPLVEIEVVVLVEQDRFGRIARNRTRFAYHAGNPPWLGHSIAMQQQKIGGAHHRLSGNSPATVRGAD